MVQWFGLHAFTAEGPGSIPGWGAKIPRAACREAKRKKERKKELDLVSALEFTSFSDFNN